MWFKTVWQSFESHIWILLLYSDPLLSQALLLILDAHNHGNPRPIRSYSVSDSQGRCWRLWQWSSEDTTGRVEDVQETGSSQWEVSDTPHLLSMFISFWHLSSQTYRSSCLSQTFLFIAKKCLFVMLPSLTYLGGWYLELVWFEKLLKPGTNWEGYYMYLTAWHSKTVFSVYLSSVVSSW